MGDTLSQQDIQFETDKIMAMAPEDFMAKLYDDPAGFTEHIIKLGIDRLIVQCLSTFLKVNHGNITAMAQQLIDNRRGYIVANHLDEFLEAGATIDVWYLFTQCVENGQAFHAINNLKSFANAGVDQLDALIFLLKNGKAQLVADNVDKFSRAGVNPQCLVSRLAKVDRIDAIANHNITKFLAAGANPFSLLQVLSMDKKALAISGREIDAWAELATTPIELADAYFKHGWLNALACNIENFANAKANGRSKVYPTDIANRMMSFSPMGAKIVSRNFTKFEEAGAHIDGVKLRQCMIGKPKKPIIKPVKISKQEERTVLYAECKKILLSPAANTE